MKKISHDRLDMLNSMSEIGLFKKFAWDTNILDEFNRYNLIYGWNYSGKTTLSRVFQCLEEASIHKDFVGGSFHFTKRDGTTVDSTSLEQRPHVRVFNRYFVQKNFRQGSDMTGANVIAVLGEENQALKNRLMSLETRLARLQEFCKKLGNKKTTIQQRINDECTTEARILNGIIGGRYDRRHLNETINSLPQNYWPLPFDEDALEKKKEQFRKATDFSEVSFLALDHSEIVQIVLKMRDALREVATNSAIDALQKNQSLQEWVQKGLTLNTVSAPCEFCGSIISKSRWAEIHGHFSEAFSNLQDKIQKYRNILKNLNFTIPTLTDSSLFPDLRNRFQEALSVLQNSIDKARSMTNEICVLLDTKLGSLEIPIRWSLNIKNAKELRCAIKDYNAILKEHNNRVATSETVKAEARRAICEHFAVSYLRDCNVVEKEKEMKELDNRAVDCTTVCNKINDQIVAVKHAIKNSSIAARRINENLAILLPGDNIKVVKINDTDFQFQRGQQVAKNMSEGERTAVAFSYFLTTLEGGAVPLDKTIIVLDDPISSLDSNHIYAVHSIIENRLAKSLQLFILTHNSSFFGITKDWMKPLNGRFYMTQRILDEKKEWHASLVRLPKLLKKFKSDYQYTYYCLHIINTDPSPKFEHLCGVPNMVRRLLEAYLGFVFPETGGWGNKLTKIIPCKETCGKIKKFTDENSHSHSLAQAVEVPDYVAHCKDVINDVLSALKSHNPAHISSLESEFFSCNKN